MTFFVMNMKIWCQWQLNPCVAFGCRQLLGIKITRLLPAAPAWVGCHNPNHHPEKSLQSLLGHKNQKRAFLGHPMVCDRYDICDKLLWQMWQNCVHISAKFGASGPDCRDLIRIWSLTPLDKQRRSCREVFLLPQNKQTNNMWTFSSSFQNRLKYWY